MQNQKQTFAAIPGQMPGAEREIVLLDRAFRQRQTNARLGAGPSLPSEHLLELSNVAFLRKDLPAGSIETLAQVSADLTQSYARTAKMCEAHAASYGLCIAAHKRTASLSDAGDRLRAIIASTYATHEKRRVLGVIFETVLGEALESDGVIGRDFKNCLNQDSLPVDLRVGLAALFAKIRQSLRQAHAIRRAIAEI